jgi:hypothetical protein
VRRGESKTREATIARFDRQATGAASSRVSPEAAAAELHSFVERQVQEILRTATGNAERIELEAVDHAREIEQEAARKSGEMLEAAFNRAWRILDGIDLMESGVGDMIHALRKEMEGFAADLGIAAPRGDLGSGRENGTVGSHAEVEQMITEQVAILFREGRSRSEAEHLVMRFKQGEDYLHVIDQIYDQRGEG